VVLVSRVILFPSISRLNIRHYGRDKPGTAAQSNEAGVELVDCFLGESVDDCNESLYKVSLRNRRLVVRIKKEPYPFEDYVFHPQQWYHVVFCHKKGRLMRSSELTLYVNGILQGTVKCPWPRESESESPATLKGKLTLISKSSTDLRKEKLKTKAVQVVFGNHSYPPIPSFGTVWWLGPVVMYRGIFDPLFIASLYGQGVGFQSSLHPKRMLADDNGNSEGEVKLMFVGSRSRGTTQTLAKLIRDTTLDSAKLIVLFTPRATSRQGPEFLPWVRYPLLGVDLQGAVEIRSLHLSDACRAVNGGVRMVLSLLAKVSDSVSVSSKSPR